MITFITTTLAPGAVSRAIEINIPQRKQSTDIVPEHKITLLKLLQIRIEVIAGKIIRLDIKSEPIIIIPNTTVTAVSTAIIIL